MPSMTRRVRAVSAAISAGLLAALAAPVQAVTILDGGAVPPASATVDWLPDAPLATSDEGPFVVAASFRGTLTAVAWRNVADDQAVLELAIADDAGGGGFGTTVIAGDTIGMAVAACGDAALVAYGQRRAAGGSRLRLARVPVAGGPVEQMTVRRSASARGSLDVACGSGGALVAWTTKVDGAWRAFMRPYRLSDLRQGTTLDLGPAHRSRVAAAASGDLALVAWSDRLGIRLKRFTIGAAPSFRMPGRPTRLLAPGRDPALAADGRHVAVGFTSGMAAELHVSHDAGVTFPDATGMDVTPGKVSVVSLASRRRQMAGTFELFAKGFPRLYRRLWSTDAGRSPWDNDDIPADISHPIDGFLVTAAGVRLAEVGVVEAAAGEWDVVFHQQA